MALGFSGQWRATAVDIPVLDADVTIEVELGPTSTNHNVHVGDFNGDNISDIAWGYGWESNFFTTAGATINIFPVGTFSKMENLNNMVQWRAIRGGPLAFADFDGDGNSDLLTSVSNFPSSYYAMVLGIDEMSGHWDLTQSEIDVKIPRSERSVHVLSEDMTGDGKADLVEINSTASGAGKTQNGVVKILPGRPEWSDVISWEADPSSRTIYGASNGDALGIRNAIQGDITNDGRSDLVLGAFSGIYVIFGSSALPHVWDLGNTRADCWIGPGTISGPHPMGLGDVNGDGYADLILKWKDELYLLDGSVIVAHDEIDLSPGSLTAQPLIRLEGSGEMTDLRCGDFDGDDRADIIGTIKQPPSISLYLSSRYSSWPTFPPLLEAPSLRMTSGKTLDAPGVGDFNKDGFSDLIFGESWGPIYVVYGYAPLTRPTLSVDSSTIYSARLTVSPTVDGSPVEMLLSGNIKDPFKDSWIPYESTKRLTLSPEAGSKDIRARFRNALGRESELASVTVTLEVEDRNINVGSNLISSNHPARIDVQMTESGRLRATVSSSLGEKVKELLDDQKVAGIWPVEWDGTNNEGRRVSPGVYILAVEAGDQQTRTKILVRD